MIKKISRKKFSIPCLHTMLLGVALIFNFKNNNQYLTLASYNYLIILTILTSIFDLIKKRVCYISTEMIIGLILLSNALYAILIVGESIDKGYALSYILLIIFFLSIIIHTYKSNEISFLISCYILSALIISFIMIIQRVSYYETSNYRYTIEFSNGVRVDPNFLCAYLSLPILLVFFRFLFTVDKFIKIYYLFSFIVIITAILMTSSRGGLLASIVGMGFIFLQYLKKKNKNYRSKILKTIILLSAILMIAFFGVGKLTPGSLDRIVNGSFFDSNGRVQIWLDTINAIYHNPLGIGIQKSNAVMDRATTHNTYLQIWLQFGFLGFICIMWFYAYSYFKALKKKNFLIIGIICSTAICFVFIEAGISIFFWTSSIIISLLNRKNTNDNGYI